MAIGFDETPGPRTRAHQDETAPFPLEFMLASAMSGTSQDETSPFLLEFEVVARRARRSRDEATPSPLEFKVVSADGKAALEYTAFERGGEHTVRIRRTRARATAQTTAHTKAHTSPPRLKWRGIDASTELRAYAERVASGEDLPPFRGPILAGGELPQSSASKRPPLDTASDSKAFLKLALALIVMSAAVVASAVLGDDAELRATGQSISHWFTGADRSLEAFPLSGPAHQPANAPCEPAAPAPAR